MAEKTQFKNQVSGTFLTPAVECAVALKPRDVVLLDGRFYAVVALHENQPVASGGPDVVRTWIDLAIVTPCRSDAGPVVFQWSR